MIIYPAIDIRNGKCVRLYKGDFSKEKIFNESPLDQAKIFADAGFKYLHLINLDAARTGDQNANNLVIKDIVQKTKLSVQLGGGIRTIDNVKKWFDIGVKKIVMGTIAVTNPQILEEAVKLFPGKIIIGIDAKNGFVAINGWEKDSKINYLDFANRFNHLDLDSIIYTDIEKDGTLQGCNIEHLQNLAKNISLPIIASGGISNINDVVNIKKLSKAVKGIIVGKAIYENKITLAQLLKESDNI